VATFISLDHALVDNACGRSLLPRLHGETNWLMLLPVRMICRTVFWWSCRFSRKSLGISVPGSLVAAAELLPPSALRPWQEDAGWRCSGSG